MIFDLEEHIGVWFDFPGGGRVQLRALSPSDALRIERATKDIRPFLHEPVDADGAKLPPKILNHEVQDFDKRDQLFNDAVILGWEGFTDKNGKEIPCTVEMKTVLMRLRDDTFRDFVYNKLQVLREAAAEQARDAEKNSSAG